MRYICKNYGGIIIPRMAYWKENIKKIEIYLKQIPIIPISFEVLKNID